MFMTFVVTSFIMWSDPSHAGCPYGLNLPIRTAYAIAGAFTFFAAVSVIRLGSMGGSVALENGERKTENGAPLRGDR